MDGPSVTHLNTHTHTHTHNYCHRRRRKRTSEYRSLLSTSPVDDGDCISYGSIVDSVEMRREGEKKKEVEEKEVEEEKATEETDSKPPINDRKTVKKETAPEQQAVQATGGGGGGGGGGERREVGLYEAMEYKRRSKEMNDRGMGEESRRREGEDMGGGIWTDGQRVKGGRGERGERSR